MYMILRTSVKACDSSFLMAQRNSVLEIKGAIKHSQYSEKDKWRRG
jgi:hypothetical protein